MPTHRLLSHVTSAIQMKMQVELVLYKGYENIFENFHSNIYSSIILNERALCELLFTLYLYSGLQPSVRGKVTSDNWNLRNLCYKKNSCHVILALITSESAHPITPVEPLKPCFWNNSEICLPLVVNKNKYLPHVVDNIIFKISVSDYPSRTVESKSLRLFWNFSIFC